MEVEIGKWVRTEQGKIMKINRVWIDGIKPLHAITAIPIGYAYIKKDPTHNYGSETSFISKVANTPQELVQKDDVVEFELYGGYYLTRKIIDVTKDTFWIDDGTFYDVNDITKILTPQGKDYICQWEAK